VTVLGDSYEARIDQLRSVATSLQTATELAFAGVAHIDRISFRVKSRLSFVRKVEKAIDAGRPYASPLDDIEDQVAGRILVFFDDHVEGAVAKLKEVFPVALESGAREPAVDAEFGYASYHEIYRFPHWALPAAAGAHALPARVRRATARCRLQGEDPANPRR
jgi:ppGpp synthetase/RelA/SpoT-type nucleotidyltranferase